MDKADLLNGGDVETGEVSTRRGTVTVRGLSRFELHLSGKGTEDTGLIEARTIAYAMVDPKMTVAEVREWQKVPGTAGDFQKVAERVRELSGLTEGAGKSAVSGDGEQS